MRNRQQEFSLAPFAVGECLGELVDGQRQAANLSQERVFEFLRRELADHTPPVSVEEPELIEAE